MTQPPQEPDRSLDRWLALVIPVSALLGLVTTIICALSGSSYYWPRWVWLGCLAVVAPLLLARHAQAVPAGPGRQLLLHAEATGTLVGYIVLIWAFSGGGQFWAVWPVMVLVVLLALHAILLQQGRLPARTRRLTDQVQTLTRTRRGALDVQAAQLRQIERDLHDGAQARLVALSIKLGRAEARLGDDPQTAELIASARAEAGAAISELRDLVRGIAPPVLTDRGLVAAVQSLAERCPLPVTVDADGLSTRMPPVVESAAYFVVAESLTNVAKHAPAAVARISLARHDSRLVLDVIDDGPGGVVVSGSGPTGLSGLRSRVEALDGVLTVVSPSGGPTIVHAELPCES
jgi:signal transduction histidine kinase